MAVDTASLAPDQLGDVGVFLLWHDAAAGRESIRELNEAELRAAPQGDLLAQTTEMHHQRGRGGAAFDDEVAIADGIQAILRDGGKIQETGHILAIDGVRRGG